ncbi:MAG: hypothetical protein NW224_27765 [Leptolyngbyaceae cyanobacterium bins.302]|nr:hypothetical protein [Leptolyngbyaceae cyanobacterium bins.302]
MMHTRSRWFLGLGGALLGVLAGCTNPVATPTIPAATDTTNSEDTKPSASENLPKIQRHLSTLWAGKPNSNNWLPVIRDDKQYPLQTGDRVKTDAKGEGWLYIDGCQVIYLFQDGELVKSPNSKLDRSSGNITSLLQGTGIWNNHCASQVVIHTDSAEIRLKGTWVATTYLPQQQLTIVMVFEGKTDVRAVQNATSSRLSDPVEVPTGYFYFSQPGDRPTSIATLAARTPHPFSRLPRLVAGLNLWKWLPRMHDRARKDNIPFPKFLATECLIKTPVDVTAWRLRSEPVNGKVLGEAANGSSFLALARNIDSGWIFGATPQGLGWVANSLACSANLSPLPAISAQPSFVPQPAPVPAPELEAPIEERWEPRSEPPYRPEPEYPRPYPPRPRPSDRRSRPGSITPPPDPQPPDSQPPDPQPPDPPDPQPPDPPNPPPPNPPNPPPPRLG